MNGAVRRMPVELRAASSERPDKASARFACRVALGIACVCCVGGMLFAGDRITGDKIAADASGRGPHAPTATAKPALKNLVKPAFLQAPFVPAANSARLRQLQGLVDSNDWTKDPFRHLQTEMVEVIDDLADGQTHTPAHVSQPNIISHLDTLIKILEKQCKGGGGGGNPNSPLRRSVLAGGPGGIGDLNAPRNSRRKWAELTPKERERILQSRTEGFPAGYEEILGEYYRRLATEDSVRAIAPPTGKPAPGTSR